MLPLFRNAAHRGLRQVNFKQLSQLQSRRISRSLAESHAPKKTVLSQLSSRAPRGIKTWLSPKKLGFGQLRQISTKPFPTHRGPAVRFLYRSAAWIGTFV